MQALWLQPVSYKMQRSSPDLGSLLSRNLLLRLHLESDCCILGGGPVSSLTRQRQTFYQKDFSQNAFRASELRVPSDDGLLSLQKGRRPAP